MTDSTSQPVPKILHKGQDDALPIEKLRARYPEAIQEIGQFRGETTVTVRAQDLLAVTALLRDDADLRFDLLEDMSSQDRSKYPGWNGTARFVTVYHLMSTRSGQRLRLKVPLEEQDSGSLKHGTSVSRHPDGVSTEGTASQVKDLVQRGSPSVSSLTGLWPGANWFEREIYDLMGIRFDGHPDLRRILMPNDWPNHPLRKDVPRGGEHVPYSMTWEDEEFQSFGQQILEARAVPQVPPKQADANKHMILNMGPQHPATHGVLRLIVELNGERVVAVYPDLGYLHSGFEKQGETIRYKDFTPYTDRMDYVSSMSNNLGYALAVEKLMGVEIPARAQVIRVIMAELQRLASHLVWLGTHVMDASGVSHALLMYAFREREQILDIFELVCGARLTYSYIRPGGIWKDVPPNFVDRVQDVLDNFPRRIDEYEKMVTGNLVWKARTQGIGKLTTEQALSLGVTGPMLRATGLAFDYRKVRPYSGYEEYDFEVPTATEGDSYARYLLRLEEMRQSLRIIRQALERLPAGPVWTADRKMALPPRQELDTSMEAVIHHFKLMTEGFTPPRGEVYQCVEGPRGELGYYLVSDGSAIPYRLHIRTPSFVNLQATDTMAKGSLIADLIIIIGTIDIILGDVDR
jgi:NADH-quinone oxidoreductase subunit C/D